MFSEQKINIDRKEIADRISVLDPDVERVLVFGSIARGEPSPGDFDLCVVYEEYPTMGAAHLKIQLEREFPGLDVFATTEYQLENQHNELHRNIAEEGIDLVEDW